MSEQSGFMASNTSHSSSKNELKAPHELDQSIKVVLMHAAAHGDWDAAHSSVIGYLNKCVPCASSIILMRRFAGYRRPYWWRPCINALLIMVDCRLQGWGTS